MTASSISDNGVTRPFARTGRRRLAAWLLLGWTAFWWNTAFAQFCCTELAAPAPHSATAPHQDAGGPEHHGSGPSPAGSDCPDLSAQGPVTASSDLAGASNAGPTAFPPLPAVGFPRAGNPLRRAYQHGLAPPARVPVYLLHQRFLI